MASTTFVDGSTVIVASWLNDVNGLVYNGTFQSSSVSLTGSLTVPVVKSNSTLTLETNGTSPCFYSDTSQNVGLGTNSLVSGFKVTSPGAIIANGSVTAYGSDPSLSSGSSRVFMDFSGSTGRIGTATGTGSGGTISFVVNNTSVATLDGSGNFTSTTLSSSGASITGGSITGLSALSTSAITSAGYSGVGTNAAGNKTISSSSPSGGSNGDIWYQV